MRVTGIESSKKAAPCPLKQIIHELCDASFPVIPNIKYIDVIGAKSLQFVFFLPRELNQDLSCNMCIFISLIEDWLRKNGVRYVLGISLNLTEWQKG